MLTKHYFFFILGLSLFWYPREVIDVGSIRHKVGVERLRAECPNLSRILEQEKVLKHLKHLPDILRYGGIKRFIRCSRGLRFIEKFLVIRILFLNVDITCFFRLQWLLVKTLNKRVESPLIADLTINGFLYDDKLIRSDNDRKALESLIPTFIRVFNDLKRDVFESGSNGERAKRFLKGDMDPTVTPASVLFPSRLHDAGHCSLALVELLVGTHNWMLDRFAEELNVIMMRTQKILFVFSNFRDCFRLKEQ